MAAQLPCARTLANIERVARRPIQPISIGRLQAWADEARLDPGNATGWRQAQAEWLRAEIPVRLAQRICDFNLLPYFALRNAHFQSVYQLYVKSFEDIYAAPPCATVAHEEEFYQLLKRLVEGHADVIKQLQQGHLELRTRGWILPDDGAALEPREVGGMVLGIG